MFVIYCLLFFAFAAALWVLGGLLRVWEKWSTAKPIQAAMVISYLIVGLAIVLTAWGVAANLF